jgi:CheY-like chemotaxis protein
MKSCEPALPIEILIVEDNRGDVDLLLEFLESTKVRNRVTVARDGEEAMAMLRRQGEHHDTARPDLILLDLNLPKKDGREVLREVKTDDNLKNIPVVVLTSSMAEQDIAKSYSLQANCFITKPVDLEQFVAVVKSIEDFWLTVVRLPTQGGKPSV